MTMTVRKHTTSSTTTATTTSEPPQPAAGPRRRPWTGLLLRQETTLITVVLAIGALTQYRESKFLTDGNIQQVLEAAVPYFVIGCGAALLVIGGGLDFSVGAVYTLATLVAGKAMVSGVSVPLSILIGAAVGAGVGVVNHLLITYLHVPPIIATLGMLFAAGGVATITTGGQDVVPLPDSFQELGVGQFLGVSLVIWYGVGCGLLFWFVLEHTRLGVNVRALGGNRQAAIGNGLRVVRLDLLLYSVAGCTAGLAGMIYAAQIDAAQVNAGGAGLTLNAVTAVLIGGVSIFGGLGSITGVAIGALLLAEISNALVLAQIDPQYNSVITGGILICSVAIDHLRRSRLYKRR